MRGGYAGSIMYVDLTNRTVTRERLPEDYVHRFIGGAGINSRLLWDLVDPRVDAFSPDNALIFGTGPFVGTIIPGSSKSNVTAKSPHKKFQGLSGHGLFGMLKFTGHDHLIITGKASKPIYLKILNNQVEFCDASHLWGRDVWETTDAVWAEVGDSFMVSAIGPAGENLVKDASIITNKYATFARTGMGAVMGSKNLKAIAMYGTRPVKVADPKRLTKLINEVYKELTSHPNFLDWRKYGTLISLETFARMGIYAAKNYQKAYGKNLLKTFNYETFLSIKEGDVACLGCPVGCKHHLKLIEDGEELSVSISCLNAVLQSFGTFCLVKGWQNVVRCAAKAARMGLDLFSVGNLISFAMELYQRGIIDSKDTNGLELNWGDTEVVLELLEQIGRRRGFGNILADGLIEAPKHIARNAEEYAMQSKGLGLIYDPRIRLESTEIFSQFSNVRGHASNVSITMVKRKPEQIKRFAQKIGIPENRWPQVLQGSEGYNVARLTKWTEDVTSVMEFLGLCYFPMYQRFSMDIWVEIFKALTGMDSSVEKMLKAAENVWNIRRVYNMRAGATISDDSWPRRFVRESVSFNDKTYGPLNEQQMEQLVKEYYDERGWDPETGEVSETKLKELGLF
ncbi:aldehyde ferredoxin oxidoreductase family protein [Calderihabitans maritimus]|uniref:Aldehyde ferredoxin oxidoreductase n=1 Tax=Calderihabitans maritimus TaxID=1246530 RepID=A0A1Z5HPV0_9FIRM|nr:aldehyde ferredoxin oxidoreductase family protein [Calderihabitans maritimus]GAW91468.1 aldehyde ferredoxin oxidoreductase [Calderihabitans maritimus]